MSCGAFSVGSSKFGNQILCFLVDCCVWQSDFFCGFLLVIWQQLMVYWRLKKGFWFDKYWQFLEVTLMNCLGCQSLDVLFYWATWMKSFNIFVREFSLRCLSCSLIHW